MLRPVAVHEVNDLRSDLEALTNFDIEVRGLGLRCLRVCVANQLFVAVHEENDPQSDLEARTNFNIEVRAVEGFRLQINPSFCCCFDVCQTRCAFCSNHRCVCCHCS
jgi:hypothetical protein